MKYQSEKLTENIKKSQTENLATLLMKLSPYSTMKQKNQAIIVALMMKMILMKAMRAIKLIQKMKRMKA